MDNNAFTSLFLFFATTTLIIIAAYYATRFIGQKAAGFSKTKHVSLLEKNILPGNLSVEVVKVADNVYILACRGKDVTLLDQYSMDEWLEMKSTEQTIVYDPSNPKMANPYKSGLDYIKKRIFLNGHEKKD